MEVGTSSSPCLLRLGQKNGDFENSYRDSQVAQTVKSLPVMWETWVQFLGRENPLEKEVTTASSILAWRIPRMEDSGGLQSTGSPRDGHD